MNQKRAAISFLSLLLVVCLMFACAGGIDWSFVRETNVEDPKEKVIFEGIGYAKEDSSEEVADKFNEKNANKTTLVLQLNNVYDQEMVCSDEDISLEEAQALLKEQRENVKAYYSETNPLLFDELDLSAFDLEFEVDTYSPYVYAEYEDKLTEKDVEDIYVLAENEKINRIYVQSLTKPEEELDDAFEVINGEQIAQTYDVDGSGIVIGILEVYVVDADNAIFENVDVTVRQLEGYMDEGLNHPLAVAVSALKVAPGASILSASMESGIIGSVSWMLDNGVNIINMSFAYNNVENGTYTMYSGYCDYIARYCGVVFTGSAGNEAETHLVTSPNGYNTLTVGACNNAGERRASSSYIESFTINFPRLVAPGEYLYIPAYGYGSGTSFAAPLVAGAVALMMEKSPSLVTAPHIVMALIMATTQRIDQYAVNTGFNNEVGTGLLDVYDAVRWTSNRQNFIVSEDQVGEFVSTRHIYVQEGQRIRVAFVSLVNSDMSPDTERVTDYDLYLYNDSGSVKRASTTLFNNEFVDFVAEYTGYYAIKIKQYSAKKTDIDDYCAYAWHIE